MSHGLDSALGTLTFRKILVIRFSSIGDLVLTTPVLRCLKQQTNAEIHLLCKSKFADVLQGNPYVDLFWTIDSGILDTARTLQNESFDLVIDLHKNTRSYILSFLLTRKVLRFDKINVQKWLMVRFKKNVLPDKHIVDRYFESLARIGVYNDGKGLDYFIGDLEEDVWNRWALPDKYIVGVLGATYTTKQIPVELWERIIKVLPLPIVLVGGKDIIHSGLKLKQAFGNSCVDLCGRLSIKESAAVISKAEFVITSDTGMMHIAAALKKPVHVFWGNTIPAFGMYPYYGHFHVPYKNHQVEQLRCRPCSKLGFPKCPKGHFKCMNDQNIQSKDFEM